MGRGPRSSPRLLAPVDQPRVTKTLGDTGCRAANLHEGKGTAESNNIFSTTYCPSRRAVLIEHSCKGRGSWVGRGTRCTNACTHTASTKLQMIPNSCHCGQAAVVAPRSSLQPERSRELQTMASSCNCSLLIQTLSVCIKFVLQGAAIVGNTTGHPWPIHHSCCCHRQCCCLTAPLLPVESQDLQTTASSCNCSVCIKYVCPGSCNCG